MRLKFKLVDDDIDTTQEIEEPEYTFDVIDGSFSLGGKVTVELNGKEYTRTVYDDSLAGLYVRINGRKYFQYEADYTKYYENKKRDN